MHIDKYTVRMDTCTCMRTNIYSIHTLKYTYIVYTYMHTV